MRDALQRPASLSQLAPNWASRRARGLDFSTATLRQVIGWREPNTASPVCVIVMRVVVAGGPGFVAHVRMDSARSPMLSPSVLWSMRHSPAWPRREYTYIGNEVARGMRGLHSLGLAAAGIHLHQQQRGCWLLEFARFAHASPRTRRCAWVLPPASHDGPVCCGGASPTSWRARLRQNKPTPWALRAK